MGKPRMTQGLRDAVWAATYVRVLSCDCARVDDAAEVLSNPYSGRQALAVEAATHAVRALEAKLREP